MGTRLVAIALVIFALPYWCSAADTALVFLSRIEITSRCADIEPHKVQAGAILAFELSRQYRLLTASDSIVRALRDAAVPSDSIAARAGAARQVTIRLDCFQNLLRADIELRGSNTRRSGTGYALVRHRWEQNDRPLRDPAVLEALQRAVCVATGDSTLYSRLDSTAVRPATLVAVTSMELQDNPSLPLWELFEDAIATCYSGVLAAITGGQRSRHYVVLDLDTRDSMYAFFKLYEPEPAMPPSKEEIAALAYFGVNAIVSGTLERTTDGALLELRLYRIASNGTTQFVARRRRSISDDSRVAYLTTVAEVAEELLSSP
ncbi:MAG: hypothetical protein N2663_02095 [Chlorobi bacterium]|nr:hypothetical protein [Chlorobiota bacterium]